MRTRNRFPKDWNEARVKAVLEHYESQTEDEAVAEDEAAFRRRDQAVMLKAAASNRSISHVVNEAVRMALAEDAEDIKAIRERASEKNLDFADVVKSLRRRGKL